jgi:hypothetical protein
MGNQTAHRSGWRYVGVTVALLGVFAGRFLAYSWGMPEREQSIWKLGCMLGALAYVAFIANDALDDDE